MDPVAVATIVIKTTDTCLGTIKRLSDLRSKYKTAPVAIASICSESTVLSASLSQIQALLLRRQDLADVWKAGSELPSVLDTALTGCMVVFSCLDDNVDRILGRSPGLSQIGFVPRVRMLWNGARMQRLLSALRGQQTALNLLIQLLQMGKMTEIKRLLQQSKSKRVLSSSSRAANSLRSGNPSVRVLHSIYDGYNNDKCVPESASVTTPLETEFDFDDLVINSRAYRRAFAQAEAKAGGVETATEECSALIDFSDSATTTMQQRQSHEQALCEQTIRDLQGLSLETSCNEDCTAFFAYRTVAEAFFVEEGSDLIDFSD